MIATRLIGRIARGTALDERGCDVPDWNAGGSSPPPLVVEGPVEAVTSDSHPDSVQLHLWVVSRGRLYRLRQPEILQPEPEGVSG